MAQSTSFNDTKFSFVGGSSADLLTAASAGTQSGALALTDAVNRVTTAAAGASVGLPATVGPAGAWNLKGCPCIVINASANDILVYPAYQSGDTINGGSSTAAVTLPAGAVGTFIGATGYNTSKTGNWYASISTGAGGPLDAPLQIVNAAGSNSQSAATAVTPGNVIVATVTGTTRGIRLSAAGTNKSYIVFNDTATAVKVYPATGASIASASNNVAVQVGAHHGEIFLYRSGTHVVVMGATGV